MKARLGAASGLMLHLAHVCKSVCVYCVSVCVCLCVCVCVCVCCYCVFVGSHPVSHVVRLLMYILALLRPVRENQFCLVGL